MGTSTADFNISDTQLPRYVAHLEIWISKIRTAFSTLLTDDAESPARAAGVQDESEDTTSCTRAGLCLTKLLQE